MINRMVVNLELDDVKFVDKFATNWQRQRFERNAFSSNNQQQSFTYSVQLAIIWVLGGYRIVSFVCEVNLSITCYVLEPERVSSDPI